MLTLYKQFSVQTFFDMARGQQLALPTGQGRRVHREHHRQGRLLHDDGWQGPRLGHIAQRIADEGIWHAGDGGNIACFNDLLADPIQALVGINLAQ